MKNKFGWLIPLLICTAFISCNMYHRKIVQNNRQSIKRLDELTVKNGNAFWAGDYHSPISIIWSYSNDTLFKYKISGKKVLEDTAIVLNGQANWTHSYSDRDYDEITGCLALHGEFITFKYRKRQSSLATSDDFHIIMDCFLKTPFKSVFLQGLSDDIAKYNLKLKTEPIK